MLMINIVGLLLIGMIVWWFWLYQPPAANAAPEGVEITVDNGVYQPARISLPAHQPATLNFLRRDPSPCAEMLQFDDLDISETLPVDKLKAVRLPGLEPGEYEFHCQMRMYRGKVIVN